jgi:hypothetical protein
MPPPSPTTATTSPQSLGRTAAPRAPVSPVASPPHRPSPSWPPPASTDKPECCLGRSLVVSCLHRHAGPPWTAPRPWSMKRGLSPQTFPLRNKSESQNSIFPGIVAKKTLSFFVINPQSIVFTKGPWNLENNFIGVPSLRKIHKMAPETSKLHIFSTTTPNSVILVLKFSESLPLSFYAFI